MSRIKPTSTLLLQMKHMMCTSVISVKLLSVMTKSLNCSMTGKLVRKLCFFLFSNAQKYVECGTSNVSHLSLLYYAKI